MTLLENLFFGTVAALLVATIVFVTPVVNHCSTPGYIAAIEQLRIDAGKVDVRSNEDVLGQVTDWNQQIVSWQRYNKLWWAAWAVPDAWDDVELIEIPEAQP